MRKIARLSGLSLAGVVLAGLLTVLAAETPPPAGTTILTRNSPWRWTVSAWHGILGRHIPYWLSWQGSVGEHPQKKSASHPPFSALGNLAAKQLRILSRHSASGMA
jgi:hypothetical protein